jgi:hypothetical protein
LALLYVGVDFGESGGGKAMLAFERYGRKVAMVHAQTSGVQTSFEPTL